MSMYLRIEIDSKKRFDVVFPDERDPLHDPCGAPRHTRTIEAVRDVLADIETAGYPTTEKPYPIVDRSTGRVVGEWEYRP